MTEPTDSKPESTTAWDQLFNESTPSVEDRIRAETQRLELRIKELEERLEMQELILAKATHRESHLVEEMQRLRAELNAASRTFKIGPFVLTWSLSNRRKKACDN